MPTGEPVSMRPEDLAGKTVRIYDADGVTYRDVTFGEVQYPDPSNPFEVAFTITPLEEAPDGGQD